jgi:hypothetical protein
MKFIRSFTVLLIFSTGCSLFKQTSKTSGEAHTLSQHDTDWTVLNQYEQSMNTNMLQLRKDTGNTTYSIQLWPKGSFTLSAEKGFAGEAEKIVIAGKTNRAVMTTSAVAARHEQKGQQAVTYKERDKKETEQKQEVKDSSVSWRWIIAGFVLMLLAAYWVYRRKNSNLSNRLAL